MESDSDHILFSSTGANVDLQMCLYKPGTTKKHKHWSHNYLVPLAIHPVFELYLVNWECLSPPLEQDVATPHDNSQSTEYSKLQCGLLHLPEPQKNILKPIKVLWPNLSCWGSHSIPCIQVTHRALSLSTPSQHIQPKPSIACLTWHIITVEIFVYFVRVPQSALQPTAKSSQLPLLLSQPESLIKTRCFHLGQLWKKSLPETGLSLPSPTAVGLPCVAKLTCLLYQKRLFLFKPKCATESSLLHQSGALKDPQSVPLRSTWNIVLKTEWVVIKNAWGHLCYFSHSALSFNTYLITFYVKMKLKCAWNKHFLT